MEVVPDNENVDDKNGVSAFDVFPAELWCQILENITDPVTLGNCSAASDELRDIIMNTRYSQYKLPEVLSLVISKTYPELTKSDVLSMRHTCKDWKTSIDLCIEHNIHASSHPFPANKNLKIHKDLRTSILRKFTFQEAGQINVFMHQMESYPMSTSIPFNFVEFQIQPAPNREEFKQAAEKLLQKYGAHLNTLHICKFNENEFLPWLGSLLRHTPNLEKLHLNTIRNNLTFIPDTHLRRSRLRKLPPRPSPEVVLPSPPENPDIVLPPLVNLKNLSAMATNEEVVTIIMKHYNRHIKSAKFYDCVTWPLNYRRDLGTPNMANLKTLSISAEDYLHINLPLVSTWPVEWLQITVSKRKSEEFYDIFAALNNFGHTLKCLDLFPWSESDGMVGNLNQTPPHLPHLEILRFKIEAMTNGNEGVPGLSCNFITHLVSLTELRIKIVRSRYWQKEERVDTIIPDGEQVQIIGYTEKMYNSNIWNLLPTLQVIIVEKEIYRKPLAKATCGKWVWTTIRYSRSMLLKMRNGSIL